MARNPADLEVTAVDAPDAVPPEESRSVEVTVRNRNSQPAPGETHDVGFVAVESGALSPSLVILDCFVIAPGATHTVDDCSSAVDGCGDGDFTMPSGDVTLDVYAGGFQEGTNCADVAYRDATDHVQHDVVALRPATIADCSASPRDASYGDTVALDAEVRNPNPVSVDATVEFRLGGTRADVDAVSVPANSTASAATSVEIAPSYPGGEGSFDYTVAVVNTGAAAVSASPYRRPLDRFRRTLTA